MATVQLLQPTFMNAVPTNMSVVNFPSSLGGGFDLQEGFVHNLSLAGDFFEITGQFGGTVTGLAYDGPDSGLFPNMLITGFQLSYSIFADPNLIEAASNAQQLVATILAGNDTIHGSNGFFGDTILAYAGNDTIFGGAGVDTMHGMLGNDTYYVRNAGDQVIELTGEGTDTVNASTSYALAANASVEVLRTFGSSTTTTINLTGSEIGNTLLGNAAANRLDGRGSADTMQGFAGNDTYFVDNAGDVVFEASGGGSDTVIVTKAMTYALGSGVSVEVLRTVGSSSTYSVTMTGNAFSNVVVGNNGVNIMNGGAGTDTMTGFGGSDTFFFNTALGASNIDTIGDFNVAADTIRLENGIFTGLAGGTLPASAFRIGAAAADSSDRIIYNSSTGALIFDVNGNGFGGATQFAKLSTGLALTFADFSVI